jgi:hypothetical protein
LFFFKGLGRWGFSPSNFPQQQQIGLKVSGFYIIWRLLRGWVCLHGRTSRDAFKAMKPGYTFFELYKKTIVFFKPKLLTNKHYEDTDGTGNNSPYYFNCYLVYFGIDFIAGTSCFTYIG